MEQKPCIVFRVDGSEQIGIGHIMRCLTLADEMAIRGAKCIIALRGSEPWILDLSKNSPHQFLKLPEIDMAMTDAVDNEYATWLGTTETIDAVDTLCLLEENSIKPDIIVVDHYALGCEWEEAVLGRTDACICVIDDLDRSHSCDVLIDTTFGKTPVAYAGRVPDHCKLLVGATYALLRPQFSQLRPQALARRDADCANGELVQELLIAMGGADDADATGWMLDACSTICAARDIKITILVGGAYPHKARLLHSVGESLCEVEVLQSTTDVASVLARADIAIGAAGSSSWERCCMGLPTISLTLAENQTGNTKALASANAIVDGGVFNPTVNPADWADEVLHDFIDKTEDRKKLSEYSRAICAGDGTLLVINALLQKTVQQSDLKLRQAKIDDAALLHQWQSYPETRRYSGNSNIPSWETHNRWMTNKLSDPDCLFYISTCEGWSLGMVRLDPRSSCLLYFVPKAQGSENVEISILTAPAFQGLRVGLKSLLEMALMHPQKTIYARVLEENQASQKLFGRVGFVQYKSDYLVKIPIQLTE